MNLVPIICLVFFGPETRALAQPHPTQGEAESLVQKVHQHIFESFVQNGKPQDRDFGCPQGEGLLGYRDWQLMAKIGGGGNACLTQPVQSGRGTLAQWLVQKPRDLIEQHKDIQKLLVAPRFLLDELLTHLKSSIVSIFEKPLKFEVVSIKPMGRTCDRDGSKKFSDCQKPVIETNVQVQLVPDVIEQLREMGRGEDAAELSKFARAEYIIAEGGDYAQSGLRLKDIRFEGRARIEAKLAKNKSF